jgi:hypothetical protein
MTARILFLVTLAVALLGSSLKASPQNEAPHLQIGDLLPLLAGQSLPGDSVELPTAAEGHPTTVIFSFSRAGGQRAQEWIQHLSQEIPEISIYSAIVLEAVPVPFRGVVVSGIRSRTPQPQQRRTILLYANASAWKQRLQACEVEDVCVLLLGPDSHIRWMTGGAFSAKRDQALGSQLRSIEHE